MNKWQNYEKIKSKIQRIIHEAFKSMTEQRSNWNRKSQVQLQSENHCIFNQLYHAHLEVLSLGPVVAPLWGGGDVIGLHGVLGEGTGEH